MNNLFLLLLTIYNTILLSYLLYVEVKKHLSFNNEKAEKFNADLKGLIERLQRINNFEGPSRWRQRLEEMQLYRIKEESGGWFYFSSNGATCRVEFYGDEPKYLNWFNNKWIFMSSLTYAETLKAYSNKLSQEETEQRTKLEARLQAKQQNANEQ